MNIFFGAAFDPPHKEHINIIKKLLKNSNDNLYIGITDHDYKNFRLTYEQRKEMLLMSLKIAEFENVDKLNIVKQNLRTWDFLFTYQFTDKMDKIDAIAVGEDEWKSLLNEEWKYSNLLLEKYTFIVIPRKRFISSTIIRKWLEEDLTYSENMVNSIDEPVYELAMEFWKNTPKPPVKLIITRENAINSLKQDHDRCHPITEEEINNEMRKLLHK